MQLPPNNWARAQGTRPKVDLGCSHYLVSCKFSCPLTDHWANDFLAQDPILELPSCHFEKVQKPRGAPLARESGGEEGLRWALLSGSYVRIPATRGPVLVFNFFKLLFIT